VLKPDKRQVHKSRLFANAAAGFQSLQNQLAGLGVAAAQILIGMEATSRYGDALFHFLQQQGYQLCLLHPAQTHQFALRRGLRAKTDKLDAVTIGHVLLSGEARIGYVPDELISSYRELVRLHTHLSDEIARYKHEIHALLQVLFPEFSQVEARPCRPTALAVLQRYPSAAAVSSVRVEELTKLLQQLAPRNYGPQTAKALIALARTEVASWCGASSKEQEHADLVRSTPAYTGESGPGGSRA
jgi:transposase